MEIKNNGWTAVPAIAAALLLAVSVFADDLNQDAEDAYDKAVTMGSTDSSSVRDAAWEAMESADDAEYAARSKGMTDMASEDDEAYGKESDAMESDSLSEIKEDSAQAAGYAATAEDEAESESGI
jgi:hypothetical protein